MFLHGLKIMPITIVCPKTKYIEYNSFMKAFIKPFFLSPYLYGHPHLNEIMTCDAWLGVCVYSAHTTGDIH